MTLPNHLVPWYQNVLSNSHPTKAEDCLGKYKRLPTDDPDFDSAFIGFTGSTGLTGVGSTVTSGINANNHNNANRNRKSPVFHANSSLIPSPLPSHWPTANGKANGSSLTSQTCCERVLNWFWCCLRDRDSNQNEEEWIDDNDLEEGQRFPSLAKL